ncbi:unnamed protein product [Bursaphelenchus okinawaensis]|uniref:Tetraspanin n=1 Tax=Bursaphelenchus okinawaensis TaxID=465554 RepID=A0A811LLK5_9BILA|nr:unnamed protein product [Bursaphelenchus okinawaensis]CAG9125435.1 unnamed protein product [Bursaphelenchus okinawaensis]
MRSKSRSCLLFYTLLLIINGLALIALSLWFLLDPSKSYLLDLVDFSEDDPLLKFTAYIALGTGICILFVAFVGCFGTVISGKFIMGMYLLFMVCLLAAAASIITLPLIFKSKFDNDRMGVYLGNISYNRYYRDKWTIPLMDSIQFYQKCCGGNKGALDYQNSFWYITNVERGTRSFVPSSCCKQSQDGRAWASRPIDPLCITYPYGTTAFNTAVNTQGCHDKVEAAMNEMIMYYVIAGSATAVLLLIGGICTIFFYRHLKWYQYIPQ